VALKVLGSSSLTIDTALDAYCAQLAWQDSHIETPPILRTLDEIKDKFFPFFEKGLSLILGKYGPNLPVTKNRIIAAIIGSVYRANKDLSAISEKQWGPIIEFIRRPQEIAPKFRCQWPASKGRWDGLKGYKAQFEAAHRFVLAVTK
jgi:hypothetical protein